MSTTNKAKAILIDGDETCLTKLNDLLNHILDLGIVPNNENITQTIKLENPKIIFLNYNNIPTANNNTLKSLKEDNNINHIPVLVLGIDRLDIQLQESIYQLGAFDIINSPISDITALSKINHALKLSDAEHFLRKSTDYNARLLKTIKSIIIGVDSKDRVTFWNTQAELFFSINKITALGNSLSNLKINWNWEKISKEIDKCITRNTYSDRFDLLFFSETKGNRVLSAGITPFIEEDSDCSGYLILADDITEQKTRYTEENQLHRLQSIGQLAAGIAHEINTPMQYVSDNTHYLKDVHVDLDKFIQETKLLFDSYTNDDLIENFKREFLHLYQESDYAFLSQDIPNAIDQSLEGINRVVTIVRAMKDFSHPGSDKKEALNINKAIESTISVTRNEWKYVADIETNLDPNAGEVYCYAGHLNEVILNLIINAAHAIAAARSSEKGTITISTRRLENHLEIQIGDTGTGIPEEAQPRIFDPFFTTKEVGKGTGQGLAISHSIVVEQHDGELYFETETNKGTTFYIRLPL